MDDETMNMILKFIAIAVVTVVCIYGIYRVWKWVHDSAEGFDNAITYGGITPDLHMFQQGVLPPGELQVAHMNSPPDANGFGLLSVGNAVRQFSNGAFQIYLKANLPDIHGGAVRFFRDKKVPWPNGAYIAYLQSKAGNEILLGEVAREEDGSSRLSFMDTQTPNKYNGYDKILVRGVQWTASGQTSPDDTYLVGEFSNAAI